jgi:hypothetical protein
MSTAKKTQNIHHSVPLILKRPRKTIKTQSTQNCVKMFHLDDLESPQSDCQEVNSPSTVLTSNKMFKIATNIVNRAFKKKVKIEPKLGSQGLLCLAGLHGQSVLKFPKKS